jgi:subtilisin family serine protease
LNLDYQIQREFTNPSLFYGLSIKLSQNITLSQVNDTLKSIPEVVAVYPNRLVSKSASIQSEVKLEAPTAIKTNPAINQTYTRVDSSSNLPHITGVDTASVLKMADVDKVHALGIKGKGMKIVFIDTGVDYAHPSLTWR